MREYVDFLERFSKWIFLFFTVVVLFFAIFLKDVAFEGSYKIWFDKDSKLLQEYEDFVSTFSSDESFVVSFKDPQGIFTPKAAATVIDLTKEFRTLEGIRRVDSLSTYKYMSEEENELLIEDFLTSTDELESKKTAALQDPLIVDQLLSKDATTSMFVLRLIDGYSGDESHHIALYKRLLEIAQRVKEQRGYELFISGAPAITASLVEVSQHDMLLLLPCAVVVVFALFIFLFRTVLGVVVPVFVILATFIIVMGLEIALGYKLNNFTVNIPSFVTAIAIADVMHLYLAWIYFSHKTKENKEAIVLALRYNFLPIAFTSLTTAVGFASLAMSAIEPISTFGIALSVAALVAFVLSVTLVPTLLLMQKKPLGAWKTPFLDLMRVKGYGAFIVKNDTKIVFVFIVFFLFLAYGLRFLEVDSHSIKYFREDIPVRKGSDFIEKNLTGAMIYEVIIDSKAKEGIKESAFLQKIELFEKALIDYTDVVRYTSSLKDIIVRMDQVVGQNNPPSIPSERELIAQYLLLYSMAISQSDALSEKIDTSERYLRLSLSVDLQKSSQDLRLMEWIKQWWQENSSYSVEVQGQSSLFAFMQSSVSETLLVSMGITLAIVSVLMLFLFQKIKLLWLFLLPNIAPILFVGGVMGYLGISIDLGVAVSVAVILGIAVDDTIHFFSKYFQSRKECAFEESIDRVLHHSGAAMILTTLILSLTFAVFLLSDFVPNVNFAIVTISALNLALVFDLLLLPAILSLLERDGA